ncbi:NADP-dependent phosphogluconate dehydrogenase [Photobacterium sagamiensis]|uniref:NADP-dependent phosphogluconate dehydrogenase n=1 Tax=Photobacterium sagamiensis TaxID=2910241 RepID=UPI003D0FE3D1
MTDTLCNIAMIGLGVMGRNLALNLLDNQFNVAGFDLNPNLVKQTQDEANQLEKGQFLSCPSLVEILGKLEKPRIIALSVPAGNAVDTVIASLIDAGIEANDIVIDTGNSLWTDTITRDERYHTQFKFFSTAVSGGEVGARFGPALMASGCAASWQHIQPMWEAIAAKVDQNGLQLPPLSSGEPCAAYIGPSGSGHFVKMVHNGIEYADMQLICEVYQFLHQVLNMPAREIGQVFAQWNKGILNSYLMEISADILQQQDPTTNRPLVEMILDKAGQKGTGLWTAVTSLEAGCPAPTIAQAVYARSLSGLKDQRTLASKSLRVITDTSISVDKETAIEQLHDALYCAKLCAYAQGFELMKTTARQQHWQLDFANIAKIWRAGCIIRAIFLQSITDAYTAQPELNNLLLDSKFSHELELRQLNWRKAAANASLLGVSCPGINSALNYFDAMCSETLPANLLQAQRDYFGSHTYSRIDQPEEEKFHFTWNQSPRTEVKVSE